MNESKLKTKLDAPLGEGLDGMGGEGAQHRPSERGSLPGAGRWGKKVNLFI